MSGMLNPHAAMMAMTCIGLACWAFLGVSCTPAVWRMAVSHSPRFYDPIRLLFVILAASCVFWPARRILMGGYDIAHMGCLEVTAILIANALSSTGAVFAVFALRRYEGMANEPD